MPDRTTHIRRRPPHRLVHRAHRPRLHARPHRRRRHPRLRREERRRHDGDCRWRRSGSRRADPAAEDARLAMQERLDAGNVRGPYLVWVPPRAAIPAEEPGASDFVMRAQMAGAPMQPGSRNEIDLPVKVQLAKTREEGGYASVIGGLSRFWTAITERVNGTFHVNSLQLRRRRRTRRHAPRSSTRSATFPQPQPRRCRRVRLLRSVDAAAAPTEPLGERGFAIAQAPPKIDPSDGALMRRIVRKRLKAVNEALAAVDADVKGVGLLAIYEYAEYENVGSFVKSLDPGLFAGLQTRRRNRRWRSAAGVPAAVRIVRPVAISPRREGSPKARGEVPTRDSSHPPPPAHPPAIARRARRSAATSHRGR